MKQVKVKRSSALNSDAVLKNNTKTTEENVVKEKVVSRSIISYNADEKTNTLNLNVYVITTASDYDFIVSIQIVDKHIFNYFKDCQDKDKEEAIKILEKIYKYKIQFTAEVEQILKINK